MEKHDRPPPYNDQVINQQYVQPQQPVVSVIPVGTSPPPVQPHVTQVTVNTAGATGGTCPVCHAGKFESAFTVCGWLCCIFCFPCGIICCLCMRKKKCSHCGFSVS